MSTDPNQIDPIEEQAARWHARTLLGALSAEEERKLDLWLAQSLRHRLAYAEVAAAFYALEQTTPAIDIAVTSRKSQRWPAWLVGTAAAPLLLLFGLFMMRAPHVWQDWASDVHTVAGVPKTQHLSDGSTLRLDTDTAVALDFAAGRREVQLLRGALAVEVTKDPVHPFRVHCAGIEATAVGTRFVVTRGESTVEVGVTEGVVDVRVTATSNPVPVTAGQRLVIDSETGSSRKESLPSIAYGWTREVLSFERMPLSAVVNEISRYLPERVIFRAANYANNPVTATFPIENPAAALYSVAQANGLAIRHISGFVYFVQEK